MNSLRRSLGKAVRQWLWRHDRALVSLNGSFGIDWLHDVKKLAAAWRFTPKTFFDVGANDGDTALAAVARFPGILVYSFEPHPATFERLRTNLTGSDAVPIALALGAERGSALMFEYENNKINSLVPDAPYALRFRQEARQIAVRRDTLDSFCAERRVSMIDILKIDTEGYELEVLKGAKRFLKDRAVKFIYLEFNEIASSSSQMHGALGPVAEVLAPFGFRFIASYNDYIVPEGDYFAVSNALFALPPKHAEVLA
jgi:FkbM family methyltransferase